jgi:hypothetical protein
MADSFLHVRDARHIDLAKGAARAGCRPTRAHRSFFVHRGVMELVISEPKETIGCWFRHRNGVIDASGNGRET